VSRLQGLAARLRALIRQPTVDRELTDEIALHIDLDTEHRVRAGTPPDEARRQALVAFGGVERIKELHRDARGTRWLGDLATDARYALRTLGRNRALAGAAIGTLALGIGANTAIFSAVSAVLLRPLPYGRPAQLVMVGEENPDFHWHQAQAAPANYLDWKEQVGAFAGLAAYEEFNNNVTLTGQGEPRLLRTLAVTGNFFDVVGVRTALGRALADEDTWKAPRTAVISDRVWRDAFAADRAIVGRSVQLNGRSVEIVGVLPRSFRVPRLDTDVFYSVGWDRADRDKAWFRRAHLARVVGRLGPGVTLERADAELQTVVRRLQHDYPETNTHMGASIVPLHDFYVGGTRLPLLVLLGAVAVLLLIACANVGNLQLVRAAGREREAALRLALGAGRGRLVRQALAESLVLSAIGGAAGILSGWWGARALAALQPSGMLPVTEFSVNGELLAYVVGVTIVSGALFGIAPALWTGRRAPADVLRDAGRTAGGGQRVRRWSDMLVASEVALALALTLGAGLLVRSYLGLRRVDPGFRSDGVLTAGVSLPGARYDSAVKVLNFFAELERKARALPGVDAAALVSKLPATSPSWSSEFAVSGRGEGVRGSEVLHREVSPGYHDAMHVPLLRGRLLSTADARNGPYTVVVNDAFARKFFPGEDPLGLRVAFTRVPDSTATWRTIVGVVGNEHQGGMAEEPLPEFYAPFTQELQSEMTLVVHARTDPAALGPSVRRIVRELDPTLALASLRTMGAVRAEAVARDRFLAALFVGFAAVGALLAMVGVYGIVAQLARSRTRELGIRVALGAHSAEIQWLVVRHGAALTAAGAAIGIGVALVGTRTMRSLLFQVAPTDAVTFVTVPALLVATAMLAAWIPARRASRADPAEVLRAD
jgi:predicted permease